MSLENYEIRGRDQSGNLGWLRFDPAAPCDRVFFPDDDTPNSKVRIIRADGQSNMAGNQAEVTTFLAEDQPLPNMFQYSLGVVKDYYDQGSLGDIIPAYQTLQFPDSPWFTASSMEVSLAFYYAYKFAQANPDTDVILIPTAVGNTGYRGGSWVQGGPLREQAISSTRNLVASLESNPQYTDIGFLGYIVHQGEFDASMFSSTWGSDAKTAYEYDREQLGVGEAPIIFGTMLQSQGSQTDQDIRNVSTFINNARTAVLDGVDMSDRPDGIHFGPKGLREAGCVYYDVWETMNVPLTINPIVTNPNELTLDNHFPFSGNLDDVVGSANLTQVGDDGLNAGGFYNFNGTRSITTDISITGNHTRVFRFRKNAGNGNLVSGDGNQSLPVLVFNNQLKAGNASGGEIFTPSAPYEDNQWHTLAFSWNSDSKVTELAIDGTYIGTGYQNVPTGGLIKFGVFNNSTLRLIGDIDFVKIYSGAADTNDIVTLSQQTS